MHFHNTDPCSYQKASVHTVVTQLRCADRKSAALTTEFESFARSVLATGCSARQARDNILLTIQFLLPQPMVPHTLPSITYLSHMSSPYKNAFVTGCTYVRTSSSGCLVCAAKGGLRTGGHAICLYSYRYITRTFFLKPLFYNQF